MTLPLPLPGVRKAAIFLLSLGQEASARLIRELAPDEIKVISAEISCLKAVDPDHVLDIMEEFESLATTGRYFTTGGPDRARRILESALGPESAHQLLAAPKALPEPEPVAGVSVLETSNPQQIASFLRSEHPQTIALVLSNMAPQYAGTVLMSLPADLRPQVVARMGSLDRVSPEIYQRITDAIGLKLKSFRKVNRTNGIKAVASMLNQVDGIAVDEILEAVASQNVDMVTSIRNLMFVFEDVVKVNKEGIRVLMQRADRKMLLMALKGTTAQIKQHFTQVMSERSAEMLSEDMEALGPVRIKDVEAAQQEIIALIRTLQQEGVISTSAGGDQYVD
jgi:flagellar motor switch protein FliG